MMRVAAVIPNYNGAHHLGPLFDDIAAQTRPFDAVLLADNGSTDGSASLAESRGAVVLRFGANLGFARAGNAGVQAAADADLVAVLNNDVRLSPNWLERMLAGLPDSAAYGCGKVFSALEPGLLDGTYDTVCRGGTALRSGSRRSDGPFWSESKPITFAPFTAVVIRRGVFLSVGGLDEEFGSYLEDVDFGLRCGSEGHSGHYIPDAVAWHIGSATRGIWHPRTVCQIARNQLLLVARHYPPEVLREFGWPIAVSQILWGLVALRHGRAGAWLRGKWLGVREFRRYRRRGSPAVRVILSESENEIRRIQAASGYDWYWRLYFALVR
ncbi:MAG: glycosyltransferase family 2 protein [Bryobacteraceae bacterium]|nr:glycosyltransferase family 2 protein [Bryobacteraceae bacterium]